jgi:hypothetical protein
MNEDGSRHGILVTKVFPREALTAKAWVMDAEEGKTVILVKPEYASLAYFGLREATIHWFEARKVLERKQDETKESQKTFKALTIWINGDEFEETVRHINNARKAAEETRNHLDFEDLLPKLYALVPDTIRILEQLLEVSSKAHVVCSSYLLTLYDSISFSSKDNILEIPDGEMHSARP